MKRKTPKTPKTRKTIKTPPKPVTLWKLTTADDKTRPGYQNETQWGENVTHTASGKGKLCGPAWIHAYETSPIVALMLNPTHANYQNPHVWECVGIVGVRDGCIKVGCTSLTTIRRIAPPEPTTVQRVAFAILCARRVCRDLAWRKWATAWLAGTDRSSGTAAAYATYDATDATAAATATAAANAAAAATAATATYAAAAAANAATAATAATAFTVRQINAIARRAMRYT